MAHARGVRPDATNPREPRLAAREHGFEVRRMGAVDHVVDRISAGRLVDLRDCRFQRLPGGEPAVSLHGEGDGDRHPNLAGGPGDADGLGRIVHGDGADHVRGRARERLDLLAVVRLGLIGRHRCVGHVAVAARSDAATHHDRDAFGFEPAPDAFEQAHGLDVGVGERLA